jgi:predicted PurR-regulated permease PerM
MASAPADISRRNEPAGAANGRASTPPQPRFAGDDAVPRGLAVTSAVTLRLAIVAGGMVLVALAANRLMIVVLPVIVALLLTTLLSPPARRLERRLPPGASAFVVTLAAIAIFVGLWALVIPPVVGQADMLRTRVQEGAGQVANTLKPLGISNRDVDRAVEQASSAAQDQAWSGAVLLGQWLASVVLIAVLTFFFVKDGPRIWAWLTELFHERRQATLNEVGARSWTALATYVQSVFVVATIDAVLIGAGLLVLGIPLALPLIVLTFIAAFFPIVGSFVAGAAAVLVALVTQGSATALIVLGLIILVQQLEGNVFYPLVMGRRMSLHPVAILLALTIGAALAGVAGAFLAVPVAAVTAAVLQYVRERREQALPAELVTPPAAGR